MINLSRRLIKNTSKTILVKEIYDQSSIYKIRSISTLTLNHNYNKNNNNNNNIKQESKSIITLNNSNIESQNKLNQRYFGSWGMRFILGFTIVGVMFFARRWQPRQRKRIIKKFQKGPDEIDILSLTAKERTPWFNNPSNNGNSSINNVVVGGNILDGNSIPFNREKEEAYLNKFLSLPPLGPLVIVGPEGSGKSHIVRRVISSREMSILVDMRQNAVMTGDELLLSFLKKMGYLLPSSDPISSLVMKAEKKQKINVQEIVQGLDTVFQALIEIRDNYKIVPLITISNLEAMPTSENFTRFLDWCISITDNKLANILFLTTSQFVHFHLDSNASFKRRRFVYNISFPETNQVRSYLKDIYEKLKSIEESKNTGLTTPLLKQDEIDNMIEIFGGQMRDIDLISGLILRGENYKYVVDLFLSETIHKIGSIADSMYQKSNLSGIGDKEKKSILEKYQRYWKMLETITERQTIIVNDIIQEVFDEQPEELDEYFNANVIYFWMGTVNHHNLPEISMAIKQPQLNTTTSITSIANTATTISTPTVTGYDTFVSFSSPRIQYSVKLLLNDHRFIQQRASVKKYFTKTDLKDDKKDFEEKKLLVQVEYDKVIQRLDSLFTNAKEWTKSIGEKDFEIRKNSLIQKELQLQSELDQINNKLIEIESQL